MYESLLSSSGLPHRTLIWRAVLALLVLFALFGVVLMGSNFYSDIKQAQKLAAAELNKPKVQLLLADEVARIIPLDIPLDYTPLSLNNMSAEQILATRKTKITPYLGSVVRYDYSATPQLYELIRPGAKWESLQSLLFQGRQSLCGAGPSLDTFTLMNPLLPVEAKFWGLSIWNSRFQWSERIPAARPELFYSDFPTWPAPTRLTYNLGASNVTIEYALTTYINALQPWLRAPITAQDALFSLNEFNAQELGFDQVQFNKDRSKNILGAFNSRPLAEQIVATQRTKARESCNVINYRRAPLDMFSVKELPAKLSLTLTKSVQIPAQEGSAYAQESPTSVLFSLEVVLQFN